MSFINISKNKKTLIIGNILGFILTVVMNFLAIGLPLNGKTTQELSDQYPNLFVPAGYVFAIWSVIYTLLLIFTIYQILPRNRESPIFEEISWWFVFSSLANSIWIVFWHYEQVLLSLLIMFALLISLIIIYIHLDIGRKSVSRDVKLAVHVPFSVYLGWITVATVANITAFLVSVNWDGFGIDEGIWTAIVLLVATLITIIILIQRKDVAYGLVPVWAFFGIFTKQLESRSDVSLVAAVCAILIATIIVTTVLRDRMR